MIERAPIQVGVDYDCIALRKKREDLTGQVTKMPFPIMPDVVQGLTNLKNQRDVEVTGIYTVRTEWQGEGQIQRRGFPVEPVVHTTNSPEEKIARLLEDASDGERDQNGKFVTPEWLGRIVLIDDSVKEVMEGAYTLAQNRPELAGLQARFTLAAFNSAQSQKLKGCIFPGVIHVVTMSDWEEYNDMLQQVRSRTSFLEW